MDYQKTKSGLWVPKPLRNQRGFIAPGIMPPPVTQGGPPIPSSGLVIWLVMPIAGLVNNDVLSDSAIWPDSSGSGSGLDGIGPGGANPKPIYHTNISDGLPGVDFVTNAGSSLTFNGFNAYATGWSGASIFFVAICNDDTPASQQGISVFGYSTSKHPATDSHLAQDSFSSDGSPKDLGDPPGALTSTHLLLVTSASGAFNAYFNGSSLFSTGTNTFVNNLAPFFEPFVGRNNLNQPLDGHLLEFGVWNHVLDSTERANLNTYIAARFPSTGM